MKFEDYVKHGAKRMKQKVSSHFSAGSRGGRKGQ